MASWREERPKRGGRGEAETGAHKGEIQDPVKAFGGGLDRGIGLNGEGLVGGFALAGRSKTPEKKEADEAGDDAWRVGDLWHTER